MAQDVFDKESDEKGIPHTGRDVAPDSPVASGDTSNPTSGSEPVPKKKGFGFSSKSKQPEGNAGASNSVDKPSYATGSDLAKAEGKGGFFTPEPEEDNSRFRLRKKITRKRAAAGGGIIGTSIFVTVMFSGVSQGPLQFIHMSQLLQKFHLTSNEDFGGDRTGKYLFYAMAGNAENGRLGVGGNYVANRYEANLKKQGIRPVYDKNTGRLVGFATDDKNVADSMQRDSEGRTTVKKVSEARYIKGSKKNPNLTRSDYFVDMRGSQCDFKCRRVVLKNVMQSSHVWRVNSSLSYRLLMKRGGIDMHPLNKYKQKAEESNLEFIKRILRRDAKETNEGADKSQSGTRTQTADGEVVTTENEDVNEAGEEFNTELEESAGTGDSTTDIYKKLVTRAGGGAVLAAGILCAAQDYGDSVADYKYTNSYLPMMRMGSKAISMGDQVKSNDDFTTDSLKPYASRMHDSKAPRGEQSWTDAKSIQAELGEPQTGPDLPEEAQLGNINDKPAFFDAVNKIPGLSETCAVQDFFENLPVVKEVSGALSSVIESGANVALATGDTSVEELSARALSIVAGKTINPYAKGAEYGNLANVGAFVAGNDNARAMGGAPLSDKDVAILKAEANDNVRIENANKSIAQRYFDVYDRDSFTGAAVENLPTDSTSLATLATNIGSVFTGGIKKTFAITLPQAKAATGNFNYGMDKEGFSAEERDDLDFDDVFKNGYEIEQAGKVDELNEKYGKKCFGVTVTSNATIESNEQGGEGVNPIKVRDEHPDCNPKNNTDPWFKKYRFYVADANTNTTMTCYFGVAESCAALGFANSGGESSSSSSSTTISGDAQELAQQILDNDKISKVGRYVTEDFQNTADGKPAYGDVAIALNMLQFLAELGETTPYSITSLSGEGSGHSDGSNHYSGKAVDFGCGFDEKKADEIAKKYDLMAENERCDDGVNHSHFSKDGY